MTKFEFEDETYYINGESVYDSHFIAVSADVAVRVIGAYFETIDYKNMLEDELVDFVRYIYKLKAYHLCDRVFKYGFEKFGKYDFARRLASTMTSVYRNIGQPKKAIEFAKDYIDEDDFYSIPLLTSLAAAYCDIDEPLTARKYCDQAYSLQGGGVGYINELSLVYKRIEAMLK